MPHPPPVPVPFVSGIVVGLGTLGKIQERSRVAIEHGLDMAQRFQIAEATNTRAKRLECFLRDLAESELPAIAQFPDCRVHVTGERIASQRLFRYPPAFARGMLPQTERRETRNVIPLE